jgi:hypothetical protein
MRRSLLEVVQYSRKWVLREIVRDLWFDLQAVFRGEKILIPMAPEPDSSSGPVAAQGCWGWKGLNLRPEGWMT